MKPKPKPKPKTRRVWAYWYGFPDSERPMFAERRAQAIEWLRAHRDIYGFPVGRLTAIDLPLPKPASKGRAK